MAVHYAQAPADLRAVVVTIETAADGGPDVDVLYVGASLAMNESAVEHPPATGALHAQNPPCYTEATGADVTSVENGSEIGDHPPSVVITTPAESTAVNESLGSAYTGTAYRLDDVGDRRIVVFVRDGSPEAGRE